MPEKQKAMIALKTANFSFQVSQVKISAKCTPIYRYRRAPCTRIMNLSIRNLHIPLKVFRFVPEQLSRKAKSKDGHNWTEIRYEIGTVLLLEF